MSAKQNAFVTILISGSVASITSSLMLATASLYEGKRAVQPLNATSHWLHGPEAADRNELSMAKTGLGFGTHLAATVFWAALFEFLLRRRDSDTLRPRRGGIARTARAAVATSAIAAAVDYTVTPQRFTPGWEFILPKTAMALGYAAMSAGLVLGRQFAAAI